MNLAVIKTAVTSKVGLQLLAAQKHSPAILFGAGVIGVVSTVVLASRATLHVSDVLDEFEDKKAMAHDALDQHPEKYTQDMYKRDMVVLHSRLVLDITKMYAPAVIVGVASIAALGGSHVILTKRNAALTASLSALGKAFDEYRGRVRKELGVDKDNEFMYGTIDREYYTEGKKGEPKVERAKSYGSGRSPYAVVFDVENLNFQDTLEYNGYFLRLTQNYLNDRLKAKGHVFLNDAYRELGMPDTEAGAVTGWIWGDNGGDQYIDFGIWQDHARGGLNPFFVDPDGSILLDFNVDGPIFKKLGKG